MSYDGRERRTVDRRDLPVDLVMLQEATDRLAEQVAALSDALRVLTHLDLGGLLADPNEPGPDLG